jgi:hypothetical protein
MLGELTLAHVKDSFKSVIKANLQSWEAGYEVKDGKD